MASFWTSPAALLRDIRQLRRHWLETTEADYVMDVAPPALPSVAGWEPSTDDLAGSPTDYLGDLAIAAAGAVASRYLAIGTPRTLGLVGADSAALACVLAHCEWTTPREIRVAEGPGTSESIVAALVADGLLARVATVEEALAADIVCVGAMPAGRVVASAAIRSGTHLNLAPGVEVEPALRARAMWISELVAAPDQPDLRRIAAGFFDGRQLDEVTVFAAGNLAIARRAAARVFMEPTR